MQDPTSTNQEFNWIPKNPAPEGTVVLTEEVLEGSFLGALAALFRSRKFLLALLGVIQTLVAHYFDIPAEVWGSIDALLVAVIGAIAYEDAAEKRGPV